MQIKAILGGASAMALAISMSFGVAQAQDRRIAVVGEGQVMAVPDMAQINLGVSARDATAAGALAAVSGAVDAMIAVLRAAGIAPADLQTGGISLHPLYENARQPDSPPVQVGYESLSDLRVRLRELDNLGDVLDRVAQAGGNRFSGLSLDVQDRAPLIAAARRAAVADGMAKAALYADAAGVALGPIQQIAEDGAEVLPLPMMEASNMRSMPIAPGEIEIVARLRMIFAIAD